VKKGDKMVDSSLESIVDFAIEEEHGAEELYSKTAKKIKSPQLAGLLTDMANMEKGHAAKLEAFKKGKIAEIGNIAVQDLKIGDYLVDVEVDENSSIQDIMIFSIKKEQSAHNLYTNMSKMVFEPAEKELFQHLAQEELKHKNDLEKVYDDEIYKEN
jgi:rubrerythrin